MFFFLRNFQIFENSYPKEHPGKAASILHFELRWLIYQAIMQVIKGATKL